MANDQAIQQVHKELKHELNTVFKKRKSSQFFQKVMWIITGLFFVLMILNMALGYFASSGNPNFSFLKPFQPSSANPYVHLYPIIGLVVLLYPTVYIFSNRFRAFKIKEANAIAKMVKLLFPNVEFAQNTAAPTKEVIKSKLFAWVKKDAPIYSYGQIRNSINGSVTNIADIGIVEQDVTNKTINTLLKIPLLNVFVMLYQFVFKNLVTKKSADNVYFTFRGLFCWMNFKKSLNGHTVILTNNQSSKLNRYFSSNFKEEQKINLEDPRFTDQFIVYSTDQVEARYVLSIALMERIVALKDKFDQPILLSFQDKQMYLAVQNENGLFSFPSEKIDSISLVEELFNDIDTALKISGELKLE